MLCAAVNRLLAAATPRPILGTSASAAPRRAAREATAVSRARSVPRLRRVRGFTLIEVPLVSFLRALLVTFLYGILANTQRTRDTIREELEGPKAETAILDELIADLRFVYFRPGLLTGDAGFWGHPSTRTPNGDRLDFMTCRRSRHA